LLLVPPGLIAVYIRGCFYPVRREGIP
jgi:hypothetical protein